MLNSRRKQAFQVARRGSGSVSITLSKAAMLEKLRVQLSVAATETLAVGDGINDLEMLRWAAHGVAMGHSPPSVRAVADEVCPSGAQDGLATALSRWFR